MTASPTGEPMYRVDVPAPRSEHTACACSSCACCAQTRGDLHEATLDVMDAWLAGGPFWAEMTRQQPPHPSMQRLLDSCATFEHRHHRGSSGGCAATPDADQAATEARGGGLFPAPLPARVD